MTTLFSHYEDQDVVNVSVGAPDHKILLKAARDLLVIATKALFDSGDVNYLQYGPNRGDQVALHQLAKFLSNEYRDEVKPDSLLFTAGATQGLMLLTKSLFSTGDLVIVEDPTYFIAITMFTKDLKLNVVSVSTEDDGINLLELEKVLTEYSTKKVVTSDNPYSALIYIIPTFNNPKGSILSEEKSKQIIKMLRKHNVIAICDDVYNTLSFIDEKSPLATPVPKRLFSYDVPTDPDYKGNVISCSTFSKILGPGIRLGWIEAPNHLLSMLEATGYACSGGCFNHFTACIMREAFKLGLVSKHLTMAREIYQSRMKAVCDTIDKFMPTAKYTRPKGGYFVWVVLPETMNAKEVLAISREKYKVVFITGERFSIVGNFKNCFRLSFAFFSEDVLIASVKKIAMAINELSK